MHDSKFVSHFINIINSNTFSTNWLNKTLTVNPSYLSIAYEVTEIVLWIQYAFETYYLSVCYTNQWQTIFNWWMVNLFEYFKSSISQKHPIIGLVLRIKSRKSVELPALLVLWLSVVQKKIHQIKEIKKKKTYKIHWIIKFSSKLNSHWFHCKKNKNPNRWRTGDGGSFADDNGTPERENENRFLLHCIKALHGKLLHIHSGTDKDRENAVPQTFETLAFRWIIFVAQMYCKVWPYIHMTHKHIDVYYMYM